MVLTFLLDASVLTRLSEPTVQHALHEPTFLRQVARCRASDLEIGFSARSVREWDAFQVALRAFEQVGVTDSDLVRAGQVQRQLAAVGKRGRSILDLIIAAVAERESLIVLHYDTDFDHIAEQTGQPTRWIVARGSID